MLYGMRRYDAITVFLLLAGGVIFPVVGWLAGAVMLVSSRRWALRDKLTGLLIWPGGLLPAVALVAFAPTRQCVYVDPEHHDRGSNCTGDAIPAWLGVPLLVLALIGPLVTAIYLSYRGRHTAAEAE